MRVLQLISSGGFYGAENMLLNLAAAQEEAGCQSSLLIFYNVHNPDVELYERARRRRLSVRMVRCEGRADLHAVSEIRQHVRADQSDIIHTHGYKADLYGYLAARAEKKPIVATCHNWIDGTPALGLFNRLDRLILRKFSSVAAVSPAVADKLCASGVSTEKISTIANGIDVECFVDAQPACFTLSAMPTRPIVGIVARLDLQKGFNPLLEAIAALKPKYPELLLVIVGDGPDRRAVENMVAQLGLQRDVLFTGYRQDLPSVYAALDIFVLPSFNEGLPMTVTEAMASGTPVIASRVGAIPEVITHEQTGLLVEPGDTHGLAHALDRLLGDPNLCDALGQQGREHVRQHYTSRVMADQYLRMYEKVLEARRALFTLRARPLDESRTGVNRV